MKRNGGSIRKKTYFKTPMGKTWMLLVLETVAPIKAPVTMPFPVPGVKIMLSGTPLSIAFSCTTRFPLSTDILGVTVMFEHWTTATNRHVYKKSISTKLTNSTLYYIITIQMSQFA